jgi:hypothetical protein
MTIRVGNEDRATMRDQEQQCAAAGQDIPSVGVVSWAEPFSHLRVEAFIKRPRREREPRVRRVHVAGVVLLRALHHHGDLVRYPRALRLNIS